MQWNVSSTSAYTCTRSRTWLWLLGAHWVNPRCMLHKNRIRTYDGSIPPAGTKINIARYVRLNSRHTSCLRNLVKEESISFWECHEKKMFGTSCKKCQHHSNNIWTICKINFNIKYFQSFSLSLYWKEYCVSLSLKCKLVWTINLYVF